MTESVKPDTRYKRKTRAKKTKRINLDTLERQLLNAMSRETERILVKSKTESLKEFESKAIVQFLKTVKEIKKLNQDTINNLTDEQLEELANTNKD